MPAYRIWLGTGPDGRITQSAREPNAYLSPAGDFEVIDAPTRAEAIEIYNDRHPPAED